MKTIHHLCQGGSAAAMLRAALRDPVIEILDDGSIGPLADVDTDAPDARVRFMKALFACGGFDAQDEDAMDWYGELRDMNRRFARLAEEASEVVIWTGADDAGQSLRRRAHWWLKDASVTISEIDVNLREIARAMPKAQAVALDVEAARAFVEKRAVASAELRAQLAGEWAAFKQDGDALRVWDHGALTSHPIDFYDATFAALVSASPSKLASADVLGAAMQRSGRSDLFCKWRFARLIEQEKIVVTQGDLRDWGSVVVRAA